MSDYTYTIADDLEFAVEQFDRISPMLRYVAALHPEATRSEFVAACVAAGYPANSAGNRFRESRAFDLQSYGGAVDSEGRYTQEQTS